MLCLVAMSLALAGIANARPNPQTFNNFADICPSNCDPEIITEIDNPNDHQHYYFEQMTVRGNPTPSPPRLSHSTTFRRTRTI